MTLKIVRILFNLTFKKRYNTGSVIQSIGITQPLTIKRYKYVEVAWRKSCPKGSDDVQLRQRLL